jgi:hypothetical protein
MRKATKQAPTTFLEKLLAQEEYRHAYRMAEIKKMSTKLIMLEPAARALEARGIHLATDSYLNAANGALHLSTGIFDDKHPKLYNALVDLGFLEVKRNSMTIYEQAVLKKGRLRVVVNIPNNHAYAGQTNAGGAAC